MKMKSRLLINDFLAVMSAEYGSRLNALAEFADNLGYTPKRNKVSTFYTLARHKIKNYGVQYPS